LTIIGLSLSQLSSATSSIRIPLQRNALGLVTLNVTAFNTGLYGRLGNHTIRTHVHLREGPGGSTVEIHTSNDEGGIAIEDMIFNNGGFSSSFLSIRRNSWIRTDFGPIAYTGNELVLNSSRDAFLATCSRPGSSIQVPFEHGVLRNVDRFSGGIRSSDRVFSAIGFGIQFNSSPYPPEVVGSIPQLLFLQIVRTLQAAGSTPLMESRIPSHSRFVQNCTQSMLGLLPNILVRIANLVDLVLFPEDYIRIVPERNECIIRFALEVDPRILNPDYFVNPLMLPGMNFRISNDFFEVCESNSP
jgi:hypothetical protein